MNQHIVSDIDCKIIQPEHNPIHWMCNIMQHYYGGNVKGCYHALAYLAKLFVRNLSAIEQTTRITYSTCQVKPVSDISREFYIMHRHIVKLNYDKAFVECLACMKALYSQVYPYSD